MRKRLKQFTKSRIVQTVLGRCAGTYLLFVGQTNRISTVPENIYSLIEHDMPVIVTMWHGEHFMLPSP